MNAIVTICIGITHQKYAQTSYPTIEKYARKIGAKLITINQTKLSKASPHFEKFQLYDLLTKYDRIIYLDTDLIIHDDCPNLFDIVPEDEMGAFDESPFRDHQQHMEQASTTYHIDINENYDGSYYNTGVMVISRLHRDMFKLPSSQSIYNHFDQSYLNLYIQANNIKMFKLHHKFNRMPLLDEVTGEHRLNSNIIHYAGILNNADKIMINDLQRWSNGITNIPKKAILAVGARLGDVISAEPIIRHMIEKEYRDYEVTILTSEPRVFAHYQGRAHVVHFNDFQRHPDHSYLTKNIMLPQSYPIWHHMTANAMHIIDWMAINCLKHTLPDDEKQIQLATSTDGYTEVLNILNGINIEELIVIHPGKSWPSKTFPSEYWQEIIRQLIMAGFKVGVIGKEIEEIYPKTTVHLGTIPLELSDEVIDFRELLSLDGLFSLLSKAPVLISNDSAPIHIAGAFDNHIILIPTCKHPDFVMPWRNSNKYYKGVALVGEPMWESPCKNPQTLYGYDITTVPIGHNIIEYLPKPEKIIDIVMRIMVS